MYFGAQARIWALYQGNWQASEGSYWIPSNFLLPPETSRHRGTTTSHTTITHSLWAFGILQSVFHFLPPPSFYWYTWLKRFPIICFKCHTTNVTSYFERSGCIFHVSSSFSEALGLESSNRTHQPKEELAGFTGAVLSGQMLFLEESNSGSHSGITQVTDWRIKLDCFHLPLRGYLTHVCRAF